MMVCSFACKQFLTKTQPKDLSLRSFVMVLYSIFATNSNHRLSGRYRRRAGQNSFALVNGFEVRGPLDSTEHHSRLREDGWGLLVFTIEERCMRFTCVQALESDFMRLDANKDGVLHFDEIIAGMCRTGRSSYRVPPLWQFLPLCDPPWMFVFYFHFRLGHSLLS